MTVDLAQLNRQLGAPGRIVFRGGNGGLPVAAMASVRGACEVCLYGGQVLNYRPAGHAPVLWLSPRAIFEEGKPIRGGIPVCWPWFGRHPSNASRPKHGFARLRPWQVRGTSYTSQQSEIRLELREDETTLALWPHAFELGLRVALDGALNLALTARNRGHEPFTYTQALHSYFFVRQVMDISIRGLEGTRYRDETTDRDNLHQEGPVVIRGETDRVYRRTAAECIIGDPGIGRQITVRKRGSHTTVVWNPWSKPGRHWPDLGGDDYTRMVCVESANAGDDAVTLQPGEAHTLSLTILADLCAR